MLGKTVTVGRGPTCDIRLDDAYVSAKHCQVVFRRDHFTAIDLGSLNGTRVNDQAYIQKNLRDGDILRLGKTELRFLWKGFDPAALNPEEDVLAEGPPGEEEPPVEPEEAL